MNQLGVSCLLWAWIGVGLGLGGCSGSTIAVGGTGGAWSVVGGSPANTGGASTQTGGTSAGGASVVEAGGTCAGLDGDWNLVPMVTGAVWRSARASELDVGFELRPIAITLSQRENRCQIALRPQWEPEITADLQWVNGALVYEPSVAQTWASCRSETWRLLKLQIEPGTTPSLQMTSPVDQLMDDIMNAGTLEIGGTLLQGPLAMQIVGFGPSDSAPDWCWSELTENWSTTVLPWDTFKVATRQPQPDLVQHLATSANDQNLELSWRNPDDLSDIGRVALASTTHWEIVTGKTVHVAVGAGVAQMTDFEIPPLALSDGFVGDSLDLLASAGTRSIETGDTGTQLHLTGQSCGAGVLAAGRLHVTGKQNVVFSVTVNEPYGGLPIVSAAVISPDNTASTAQLVSADDAPSRIYSASLHGQDEVGVELKASGGCQALSWWPPDIKVLSIVAE